MTVNPPQKLRLSLLAGILLLSASLCGLFSPETAEAQRRRREPSNVIQLEEIVIEGRVQKPNAFYILSRSNLGYEVLDLRTSFLREVIRSVRHAPF